MARNGVIVKRTPDEIIPQFDKSLIMRGAEILWPNFRGEPSKFNEKGERNFSIKLDEVTAGELLKDGWNVKQRDARNDEEDELFYLPVAIGEKGPTPTIVMITSRGRTFLDINECGMLDGLEFEKVNLRVNPYSWSVNGNKGIKAYMRACYVWIYEDELAREVNELPMANDQFKEDEENGPRVIPGEVIRNQLELEA